MMQVLAVGLLSLFPSVSSAYWRAVMENIPTAGRVILSSGPVYDVKGWGAKGDGSTDDTTAIQNTITACPSTGCSVLFSSGNFKITSGITINNKSNITFMGWENPTITASGSGYDMFTIQGNSSNLNFYGLTITGSNTDPMVAVKVATTASGSRLTFKNNTVQMLSNGVQISSGTFSNCEVSGNLFQKFVGNGSGRAAFYTISKGNVVSNNKFLNMPRHDVYLSGDNCSNGASNNSVVGNYSLGNGIEAIAMFATSGECPVTGNSIIGNVIDTPINIAIGMDQQVIGNTVSDNIITTSTGSLASGQGLIQLSGSTVVNTYPSNNTINGNIIYNVTGTIPAIWSQNGDYNVISNNNLINVKTGIEITTVSGVISSGTIITSNFVQATSIGLEGSGDNTMVDTVWTNNISSAPFSSVNIIGFGVRTIYAGNGNSVDPWSVYGASQFGSSTTKGNITANGFFGPASYTTTQLGAGGTAPAPGVIGVQVYNSTIKEVCVSTGTAASNWALIGSKGATGCF